MKKKKQKITKALAAKPIKEKVATLQLERAKVGENVKITHSVYAGITVGEEGIVAGLYDDPTTHEPGYGVTFTKFWPQTDINSKPPFGTRTLWFPLDAIERLKTNENSSD